MTEAVLRLTTVGGAEARRVVEELAEAVARATRRVGRAGREGRQREVKETRESVAQETAARRNGAAEAVRADQLATRAKLRELARQGDAQKAFAALYAEMLKRATAALDKEIGHRGELTQKEKRQVETLALAMVVSHEQAERRRTAATRREEAERAKERRKREAEARAFVRGAPSAAAGAAHTLASGFATFSDDLREQRRVREQVDFRAVQIAEGDIGDGSAAPQLMQATQRVSERTGLQPESVIDAIGKAQSDFSNLATPEARATYLEGQNGQPAVIDMLARAAVATGSSLTDMVQAAGEFQRQLGLTNAQLPTAIAQAIQGGRLGSISFSNQARHMGAIGGAAARFLSNRPEDSLQSLATTNALFQFAGRAGGGGDVSATRAQAFLSNFTSARGQNALRRTLGHEVMGSDGQIITREGESQSQAFRRTIEEAYTRTGGNSTRFLDAVAGSNVRGRALGDQLFRDMRGHGGRLTEFSGILDQSLQATTDSTINRPFEGIQATAHLTRTREDVAEFWRQSGAASEYAGDSERQQRNLRNQHPFLASIAGDSAWFRGAMDSFNLIHQESAPARAVAPGRAPAAPGSRGDRNFALAGDFAAREVGNFSPLNRVLTGPDEIQRIVAQRAAEEFNRLQSADQARGRREEPLRIAPESIRELAQAMQRSPNDSAHEDLGGRGHGGSSDL